MELITKEFQLPEEPEFNYEELKAQIAERAELYKTIVYTDDDIKLAKEDRSDLNRLKKALNDRRIQIEKEYMKPFGEFKAKINEIIKMLDEPAQLIDARIKEYEKMKQDEKAEEIAEYFRSIEDKPDWFEIGMIWDKKWLNATKSMKSIREEIDLALARIRNDLNTLAGIQDFGFEATEEYKRSLDINRALAEGMRLAEIQKRKEAEAKAREEAEARRAEEERMRQMADVMNRPEADAVNRAATDQTIGFQPDPAQEPASWVSFQALITAQQGRLLGQFCRDHGITIRPIQ